MATRSEVIREVREEKLKKLRDLGINPYPSKIELKGEMVSISSAKDSLGKKVLVAGRVWAMRSHGAVVFADLKDWQEKIQLLFQEKSLNKKFKILELVDEGDFLAAEGEVTKTQAGEVTVDVSDFQILSKAIRPVPSQWYGLKDVEERYRKRYLDLLLNPEVRTRFNIRTQVVRETRAYLDGLGYWEVETPTLQPLYGGANAKPFKTHINALDEDFYLRIADELYLKRLVVGGYDKVYEICKDFRNEGIDLSHNPEFTMIEWYEAYADYHRMMDVTEGLFKHLAKEIFGNNTLEVGEHKVDIGKKWPRITMVDAVKDKLGLDVEKEDEKGLSKYCKENGIELVGGETKGQLIFTIFEHKVGDSLINPTWIIDYPKEVSPLSKDKPDAPEWVERFEGYIGGKEICDGWSELTDPAEQRSRFESDKKATRKDKEEAQQVDEDFIEAMEYGMPPIGGIGIGIDRLTMFFTNTWSIKEVILFPHNAPSKMTRDEAYKLVTSWTENKNLVKHMLAVEAQMKALAKHFGENEDEWGLLGLVHDADYEKWSDEHPKKTIEELEKRGEPEWLINGVRAHAWGFNGMDVEPKTKMEWAIYTCDELSGFIIACALVRPDRKLSSVTVDTVLKKWKEKSFAKGVHREQIELCEEKLGIKLEGYIGICLKSLQEISEELGL